ncbi:MAG: hypothetical protein K2X48_08295 [Chitinophagaceae bacterium]|nr:hypothetical protein [Chitinophagaceae bacterium]
MGIKIKTTCLFLLILAASSYSQTKNMLFFPQSFTGNWKGTLTWNRPGKPSQTFTMRLNIQPADSGRYTWQIIYGDDPSTPLRVDNRQYLLIPVDTTNGHWKVDERNTILLDSYWMGNRFIGAFSVGGNTIVDQYWIDEQGMHVEFISYAAKPVATTGGTSKDIPPVDSYKILSLQKGILQKQ